MNSFGNRFHRSFLKIIFRQTHSKVDQGDSTDSLNQSDQLLEEQILKGYQEYFSLINQNRWSLISVGYFWWLISYWTCLEQINSLPLFPFPVCRFSIDAKATHTHTRQQETKNFEQTKVVLILRKLRSHTRLSLTQPDRHTGRSLSVNL